MEYYEILDDDEQVVWSGKPKFLPFLFSAPISQIFGYSRIHYQITNKRIIISFGLIGRDHKIIPFEQIKNASVEVGLIDKFFHTGSISFFSGEISTGENAGSKKDVFRSIPNPYTVFKLFNKVRDTKN